LLPRGGRGIEFLLVQTRGGRWIFPQRSASNAGLTRAQSAALEAFEELAFIRARIEPALRAYFKSGLIPPFAQRIAG